MEEEAWFFDEDFALAGTELWLEEVLQKHIGILGEREDSGDPVTSPDDKRGRIDLMLNQVLHRRQPFAPRLALRRYILPALFAFSKTPSAFGLKTMPLLCALSCLAAFVIFLGYPIRERDGQAVVVR